MSVVVVGCYHLLCVAYSVFYCLFLVVARRLPLSITCCVDYFLLIVGSLFALLCVYGRCWSVIADVLIVGFRLLVVGCLLLIAG